MGSEFGRFLLELLALHQVSFGGIGFGFPLSLLSDDIMLNFDSCKIKSRFLQMRNVVFSNYIEAHIFNYARHQLLFRYILIPVYALHFELDAPQMSLQSVCCGPLVK